jgi:ABC-type polysaccharide/polyol phosphate export permease
MNPPTASSTAAKPTSYSELYVFHAHSSRWANLQDGLRDLATSLAMYPIWVRLGWRDMVHQTHRTVLGPVWSIVSTGIQVAVLGYVYGALLKTAPQDSFAYIAAGLIIWFMLAACITGGLSVYLNDAGLLKETSLPISMPAFRYTFRLLVEFLYKFVVFVIVAAIAGLVPNWNTLLTIPGVALFAINGLWVTLLLGVLGARFWDLRELVSPLMLIAFLATPVLWHESLLSAGSYFAVVNPFTHYLAMVRDPLLGVAPPALSYAIVLAITVGGWAVAIWVFAQMRNRIVYWL